MEARKILRQRLDELFAAAPRSRAAYELQEELLSNSMERMEDLLKDGMPEDQALNTVLAGIGNVDELIAALPGEITPVSTAAQEARRQKSAVLVAISVGMYILAGVVFFLGALLSDYYEPSVIIGLIVAVVICIPPTCLLVYNGTRYPAYNKKEETVVEEFREWQSDSKRSKSIRGALSSLVWTLTVILYFLVSFFTGAWNITWLLFLVAACAEAVITLVIRMRDL